MPSKEETEKFMKEFNDLCDKHSIYFEPVPQYTRETITSPWQLTCQVFLQKKTEVEQGVPSPADPEINPNA